MSNWSFGNMFKNIRILNGFSLKKTADKLGMDKGNLSKIESGNNSPPNSKEKVLKYAKAINAQNGHVEMLIIAARQFHLEKIYSKFD